MAWLFSFQLVTSGQNNPQSSHCKSNHTSSAGMIKDRITCRPESRRARWSHCICFLRQCIFFSVSVCSCEKNLEFIQSNRSNLRPPSCGFDSDDTQRQMMWLYNKPKPNSGCGQTVERWDILFRRTRRWKKSHLKKTENNLHRISLDFRSVNSGAVVSLRAPNLLKQLCSASWSTAAHLHVDSHTESSMQNSLQRAGSA